MKLVLKILGGIVAVLVALFVVQMIASESGEVVVVTTQNAQGDPQETRLWIVEHEGSSWLRAGVESSAWYQRLAANPKITVKRGGTAFTATAVPEPAAVADINRLMNEKYGWADDFIGMLFGRDGSVAIRLEQ